MAHFDFCAFTSASVLLYCAHVPANHAGGTAGGGPTQSSDGKSVPALIRFIAESMSPEPACNGGTIGPVFNVPGNDLLPKLPEPHSPLPLSLLLMRSSFAANVPELDSLRR